MECRFRICLVCAGLTAFVGSGEAQELPVPCMGSCNGAPLPFVTSGDAGYTIAGTVGTITQRSERAILNWQSFNIAAGHTVNFQQPSATSAALNRIFQNDPSRIFGALNANGQVYLINQNGIIFDGAAQTNTSSLVASTLNVSDAIFETVGITNAINEATPLAAFESPTGVNGSVTVGQGATLRSGEGGRILLIGSDVENRGNIVAPGGQAILAASKDKVYLAQSDDTNLRGLLVEVDTGGSVTNLGSILTERGNSTLIGLAVNQSGRVSATTSVSLNGSVRLLARDGAQVVDTSQAGIRVPQATRTGTLTVGENSITDVLPEQSTATAVDGQAQSKSRIEMAGRTISLGRGAQVVAPGGNVTLTATQSNVPVPGEGAAEIHLAEGSVIDVSGDTSAVVAMERNQATVRLFGNELADSPTQRGGPLSRQDINIDVRRGTPFANVQAALDNVKRTAAERLATGGDVVMRSDGNVILNPGSTVDVSGGQVTYNSGVLNTTQLVTIDGRIVDIGDADPGVLYRGIAGSYEVTHQKWGVTEHFDVPGGGGGEFHEGYIEGKDAGSITIAATGAVLNGTLLGESVRGTWQRAPATTLTTNGTRSYTEVPLQGRLAISGMSEVVLSTNMSTESYLPGSIISTEDPFALSLPRLQQGGFNRLDVTASQRIGLPSDVDLELESGADIRLSAREVQIDGAIRSPTGNVSVTAEVLSLTSEADLDVSGTWVNDVLDVDGGDSLQALHIDGGSVALNSQGSLVLAQGSRIDVGGGAQLQADGAVAAGTGGSITLTSKLASSNEPLLLDVQGTLLGYALEQGGKLKIDANSFRISQDGAASDIAGEMVLTPEFFQPGGFSSFEFVANRGGFEIAEGTQLLLQARNLQLDSDYVSQASGADLASFTTQTVLQEHMRGPTSLTASVLRSPRVTDEQGAVRVGRGAHVQTEANGSIKFSSDADIYIDGVLSAPSGQISLNVTTPGPIENEHGYRADQGVFLGETARLLARGTARLEANSLGLRQGDVLSGGEVAIATDRGYIFTADGSLIDVSGASQVLDLPIGESGQPTPTSVSSDAGAIRLTAAEGMVLSGQLRGTPGGSGASGGTLSVALDASKRDPGDRVVGDPTLSQFLYSPREIVVTQEAGIVLGAGTPVPDSLNGRAYVAAERLRDSGLASVQLAAGQVLRRSELVAPGTIRFDGDVSLSVARSLRLDAELIASSGGSVVLDAPYVGIGPSDTTYRPVIDAVAGTGAMTVRAGHIDLFSATTLTGFAESIDGAPSVNLISSGDIRAIGLRMESSETSNGLPGSLTSPVSLGLSAAQIYPSTLTDFTINVTDPNGRIVISSNGSSVTPPLSAAGRLTLSANEIVQEGVLRAPFGEIILDAEERLVLGATSVTSASGLGQTIPLGVTEFGEDWIYRLPGRAREFVATPDKNIVLRGDDIRVEAGAVIDLSGGGELTAYEFTPGTGGTRDILATANPAGSFAVVPALGTSFGVYDPLADPGLSIAPGNTIYLAGGNGLPAGEYAILPARYALLPGAFLVTPAQGTQDMSPRTPQVVADGATVVVAGQRGFAGTGIRESRWSGYTVENGAQVRSRAEYLESTASKFFRDAATIPADAGRLTIDARQSALLQGTLTAAAATGGRGSQVDLIGENLAVVGTLTGATDRVEFLADDLNAFRAETLLLGGSRRQGEGSTVLDVSARSLRVEAGVQLSGTEIMLAASEDITVEEGARIVAEGPALTRGVEEYTTSGDGAFARVSTGAQVSIERTDSQAATGRLVIEEGAQLSASSSITLDATADLVSRGTLRTTNGSLSLTSSRVSLGDVTGATGGLVLTDADMAAFQARELLLNSRSTIDIYGGVAVDLETLKLDASTIRGFDNGGATVALRANQIELSNSRGLVGAELGTGTGSLALTAEELTLANGVLGIDGFDSVTLSASKHITGVGVAGLNVDGNLQLGAPRLIAAAGAELAFTASGDLSTSRVSAGSAPAALEAGLGAKLELTGANVTHGSAIELPSGNVTLRATAPGGHVRLTDDASIDVSGRDRDFHDVRVSSYGGTVKLLADAGGVELGNNVRINVSGAPSGADAGKLIVSSPMDVFRFGSNTQLLGSAAAGYRQGAAVIDTQSMSNGEFSSLNSLLNAGGFTDRRDLRLRTGDIAVAAGEEIVAHQLTLTADAGRIDIAGRLDASGAEGGRVELYARDNVTLFGSARIDAHAETAGEQGGFVKLATQLGTIDIRATGAPGAATINVSGAGGPADAGRVHIRAPRVGNTVAITALQGTIAGAERVDLEAFSVYTASDVESNLIAAMQADTAAYMANAAAIESSLGVDGDARFHLIAGNEVRSDADMFVSSPVDLFGWRYEGEAGVLTLRAAGNLQIDQSISDGFLSDAGRDTVQTGSSWSYQVAAGADLASANSLAVTNAGTLTLAANTHVRTGTGDIDMVSGGDFILSDSSSVIYTAGENRGTGVLTTAHANALLNGDFVHNGGDVRIASGGDIRGVLGQALPDWLSRFYGRAQRLRQDFPLMWGIDFSKFKQGIGALGGGDVTITVAGDAEALSAAIATTGLPFAQDGSDLRIAGGGDLRIDVEGNISGGVFTVTSGSAKIQAGDAIRGIANPAGGDDIDPILQVGDAGFQLVARTAVALEAAFNPTVITADLDRSHGSAYFFGYTDKSAIDLFTAAGDVRIGSRGNGLTSLHPGRVIDDGTLTFPGTLRATTMGGDIRIRDSVTLYPTATGTLTLLAEGDVTSDSQTISLSDADARLLPTIANPSQVWSATFLQALDDHADRPVHSEDDVPVKIVARTGRIGPTGQGGRFGLALAKSARLYAGTDIVDLNLSVQHDDPNDLTIVEAGRDVIFPIARAGDGQIANSDGLIDINGPGNFFLVAGRNVDLGASSGVQSRGNLGNPALPEAGANITVLTGTARQPDYAGFIERYLVDADSYRDELSTFLKRFPAAGTSSDLDRFQALDEFHQREFLFEVFFTELREAGIAAAESDNNSEYQRGYDAIATLFPGEDPYTGDLKSFLSRFTTLDGGDINLLVPGGLVNAGVASSSGVSKTPDELGVVVQRDGDINGFVDGHFLVNQSRVFALDGGDITLWSSHGNLDAGRGARAALAIPPPRITFDSLGNAVVEFPPAISGSGIRGAVTTQGRAPGDVYLFAPEGIVNAGDAGIGSAGNITIGATEVLGADNIEVGGVAVGVPVDTGGLGTSLAGVSATASSASNAADMSGESGSGSEQQQASLADTALSWLEVFVVGLGEEGCKQDDMECLKRQKPN